MKTTIFTVIVFVSMTLLAQAEIIGKNIEYTGGDAVMKGYLAYDNSTQEKRPGILVVHEWWGHNEYARKRAKMLAELGYTALAVDMYGEGKQAAHPEDAGKFSGELKKNMDVAAARFKAAYNLLRDHSTTDTKQLAAIGYCFGGGVVLEMARMGEDLKGVVSFHGSLGTANPAKKGTVKASVLVLNGAEDPFIKPEQISAFDKEMKNAEVDFTFISYPGAKHSFTNPGADVYGQKFQLPLAYSKEADEKSWQEMQNFFNRIFN